MKTKTTFKKITVADSKVSALKCGGGSACNEAK